MKIMFLDESGDHSLTVIDPQYPVFVLGGIIVDAEYAEGELEAHVRQFKREVFGDEDIILHTREISRNLNSFGGLKDPEFREFFYLKLNALMRDLEYSIVACVIRKDSHLAKYGVSALDPYHFSLHVLVERFCFDVGYGLDGGVIIAECRDATLDDQLQLVWESLRIRGTSHMPAAIIKQRIVGLEPRAKAENIAGLQIADLVVSPIGRKILGKQT